jgi:hypothetical protein
MKCTIALLAIALLVGIGADAQAALFSGTAAFTNAPSSQMGAIASNTLVINNGPFGFTVSGVINVQIPAGSVSGTLLTWDVDRSLDLTYGTGPMITSTILTGFSVPPSGSFATTTGYTSSFFNQYPGVSNSTIPITLTNGAATWTNTFVQSSIFTYTSSPGNNYLRQHFELDGFHISGPGGLWILDVPVETYANPVPEPASIVGLLIGTAFMLRRKRKANRNRDSLR